MDQTKVCSLRINLKLLGKWYWWLLGNIYVDTNMWVINHYWPTKVQLYCNHILGVCEWIHLALILLHEHLPQPNNYTALTKSRWFGCDTFGGTHHHGGDHCEIYVIATHVHKCNFSVKYWHPRTHRHILLHPNIHRDHGISWKDLFGSCVYPVCHFLPLTTKSTSWLW